MRRRTFIQTLPLAAAASAVGMQSEAVGASQTAPAATAAADLPKFQAADAERFIRPDVHAGDRPSGASFSTRSPALGLSGAAGTAHPLATQTAIAMLKRGGSAVDAAVAANAVLGFVEPVSSGLGGDCFAFVWDPKAGKLAGMASSGRSPKALTLETARSRAKNGALPALGAVAVSTPGALDGWWTLHQRYGKLKWADLFGPAIAACENGDPTPQIIGYYIKGNIEFFARAGSAIEETANAMKTYLLPNGVAPSEYDVRRNPDLARTYQMIAAGGRNAFYD